MISEPSDESARASVWEFVFGFAFVCVLFVAVGMALGALGDPFRDQVAAGLVLLSCLCWLISTDHIPILQGIAYRFPIELRLRANRWSALAATIAAVFLLLPSG